MQIPHDSHLLVSLLSSSPRFPPVPNETEARNPFDLDFDFRTATE